MRYFRLLDDLHVTGRWALNGLFDRFGEKLWHWHFRRGEPVSVEGPINIQIHQPGRPLQFTLADGGSVPVLYVGLAYLLSEKAPQDVQILPARIDGQPDQYAVLNVLRVVKCIDDKACAEVQFWKAEDGQPERVGHYRAVHGLRIDPGKAKGAQIFRPWGWPVALIVSEDIKISMEQIGALGAKFIEV